MTLIRISDSTLLATLLADLGHAGGRGRDRGVGDSVRLSILGLVQPRGPADRGLPAHSCLGGGAAAGGIDVRVELE